MVALKDGSIKYMCKKHKAMFDTLGNQGCYSCFNHIVQPLNARLQLPLKK